MQLKILPAASLKKKILRGTLEPQLIRAAGATLILNYFFHQKCEFRDSSGLRRNQRKSCSGSEWSAA